MSFTCGHDGRTIWCSECRPPPSPSHEALAENFTRFFGEPANPSGYMADLRLAAGVQDDVQAIVAGADALRLLDRIRHLLADIPAGSEPVLDELIGKVNVLLHDRHQAPKG